MYLKGSQKWHLKLTVFVFFQLCSSDCAWILRRQALPVWIFITNESQDISCKRLETHPYFCIVEVHTHHFCRSSQEKQCCMTQFRKIMKILLVYLYALDLHWVSRTSLTVTTQYLQNITYNCLAVFDLVISQLVISYAPNPSEIRTSRSKDVCSQRSLEVSKAHIQAFCSHELLFLVKPNQYHRDCIENPSLFTTNSFSACPFIMMLVFIVIKLLEF